MNPRTRWGIVGLFAVAMGYLEAAVVFYLRTMVNRLDPYQADPLPDFASLALPEILREAATMIMLITIGSLAGRTWRGRIGFTLLTFGIWDISYYLFLNPLTGWPKSIFNWDILFLIPLPWWGPVWAPTSIAMLMIVFGIFSTWLEQGEPPIWPGRTAIGICAIGIALGLYVFMADAIKALAGGETAIRQTLPEHFQAGLFLVAIALMSTPVLDMGRQLLVRYR